MVRGKGRGALGLMPWLYLLLCFLVLTRCRKEAAGLQFSKRVPPPVRRKSEALSAMGSQPSQRETRSFCASDPATWTRGLFRVYLLSIPGRAACT